MNNKAKRRCAARGCRVPVYRSYLMCSEHWRQVPMLLRRELSAAYTARGGKPSSPMTQRYADAMIACITYVAQLEADQALTDTAEFEHSLSTAEPAPHTFGDDTPIGTDQPSAPIKLTDAAREFAADHRRALDMITSALGVPASVIYGDTPQDINKCGYGVIDQRFADDRSSVVCVVGCDQCPYRQFRELAFEINVCATCNARGGTVSGEMQGDGYMTGYVEWFESCDDCIGNGLCPGCGNLTIDIEAANNDIDSVTCAVCGWHYDADRFYDADDYYDDGDDGGYSEYLAGLREQSDAAYDTRNPSSTFWDRLDDKRL